MAPRATWTGVLQVSLVAIPIKVYPAIEEGARLSFNQLHDDCKTRISQKKWCAKCAREVPSAEIVKGFEFATGKYVELLEAELDAVATPSTKVIELVQFVRPADVERRAIDRAYYLAPDGPEGGPASTAYALLGAAMAGSIGIGKLAMYGHESLVAVDSSHGSLLLYTLHHAAELREAPYVVETGAWRKAGPEVRLASQIVAALTRPLEAAAFVDQYQADLQQIIDAKIAGHEIVESVPVADLPLLNLHEALTRSLLAVSTTTIPAKASVRPPKRKRA